MEQPETYKTLRDEFAIAAMTVLLYELTMIVPRKAKAEDVAEIAEASYLIANIMLKAREVE